MVSVVGPDVGVVVFHHVDRGLFGAGRSAVDTDVARDKIGLFVRMGPLVLGDQPAGPGIRAVVEQEPVDVLISLVVVLGGGLTRRASDRHRNTRLGPIVERDQFILWLRQFIFDIVDI